MSMKLMVQAMQCKVGNPARKLVLLKLADNANDKGECFPSYQYVADQCEISKRSVIEHIKQLEADGFVQISHRKGEKGNSSNLYILTLTPSEKSAPPLVQNLHQGSENSAPPPSAESAPITSHSFEPVIEPEKNKQKRFAPPSEFEVASFAKQNALNLTGFFDYYESNGWMVGRNKMKNWQAAARGWSKRQTSFGKKPKPDFNATDYTAGTEGFETNG